MSIVRRPDSFMGVSVKLFPLVAIVGLGDGRENTWVDGWNGRNRTFAGMAARRRILDWSGRLAERL